MCPLRANGACIILALIITPSIDTFTIPRIQRSGALSSVKDIEVLGVTKEITGVFRQARTIPGSDILLQEPSNILMKVARLNVPTNEGSAINTSITIKDNEIPMGVNESTTMDVTMSTTVDGNASTTSDGRISTTTYKTTSVTSGNDTSRYDFITNSTKKPESIETDVTSEIFTTKIRPRGEVNYFENDSTTNQPILAKNKKYNLYYKSENDDYIMSRTYINNVTKELSTIGYEPVNSSESQKSYKRESEPVTSKTAEIKLQNVTLSTKPSEFLIIDIQSMPPEDEHAPNVSKFKSADNSIPKSNILTNRSDVPLMNETAGTYTNMKNKWYLVNETEFSMELSTLKDTLNYDTPNGSEYDYIQIKSELQESASNYDVPKSPANGQSTTPLNLITTTTEDNTNLKITENPLWNDGENIPTFTIKTSYYDTLQELSTENSNLERKGSTAGPELLLTRVSDDTTKVSESSSTRRIDESMRIFTTKYTDGMLKSPNDSVINKDVTYEYNTVPDTTSKDRRNTKIEPTDNSLTTPTVMLDSLRNESDVTSNNNNNTTEVVTTIISIQSLDVSESSTETFSTEAVNRGVMSSLRAGFLRIPSVTESHNINTNVESPIAPMDAEDQYLDSLEVGNRSRLDGRGGQIEEDTLREEFLKERVLQEKERFDKQMKTETTIPPEDFYSVRPLKTEKLNTSLYSNSNYKPLKKLDIQPTKPYVRDPDDNSWRNESIISLGIVFKPKNATKAFTEVLKNKTETDLSSLSEKGYTTATPDLRQRLSKIAESRKKKKKTLDYFGNIQYSDYEESNIEGDGPETTAMYKTRMNAVYAQQSEEPVSKGPNESSHPPQFLPVFMYDVTETTTVPTEATKTSSVNYHDSDYDDYASLSKMDLKRFKAHTTSTEEPSTTQTRAYFPERKATVQYFPPTTRRTADLGIVESDYEEFRNKINHYTVREVPTTPPAPPATSPVTSKPHRHYTVATPHAEYRGSYVIRHYGDLLRDAARDADDGGAAYAEPEPSAPRADDAYELQFRKDVLERFVNNFNQNSERFKVDFPVVYNSSVAHGSGGAASASLLLAGERPCLACNLTVELSPAYELHYYVPEEEEKQEPDHDDAVNQLPYPL